MRARVMRPGHGAASGEVTTVTFGPVADRMNAADRAHRGDLEGAEQILRARAHAGDGYAARELAVVLARSARTLTG